MNLSNLPKITAKSGKRIGRGHGSGKGGHTSTRGHKGQKARGSIGLVFEGSKLKKSWIKRLPLVRGKGKFKSRKEETVLLSLKQLEVFKGGEKVTLASLKEKLVLPSNFDRNVPVKILDKGEIKVALRVFLPCSKKAAEKIKKAGGKLSGAKE